MDLIYFVPYRWIKRGFLMEANKIQVKFFRKLRLLIQNYLLHVTVIVNELMLIKLYHSKTFFFIKKITYFNFPFILWAVSLIINNVCIKLTLWHVPPLISNLCFNKQSTSVLFAVFTLLGQNDMFSGWVMCSTRQPLFNHELQRPLEWHLHCYIYIRFACLYFLLQTYPFHSNDPFQLMNLEVNA